MTDNQGLSYLKDTIEKQFQSNKQVKADGVHNIIREIKDGYNELCNHCYSHVKYDIPSDKDDCYSVPDKDCEYLYIKTL